MQRLKISGGNRLFGEIEISGAKNSVLPIMSAAILSQDKVILENVPNITDVENSCSIIKKIGGGADFKDDVLILDNKNIKICEIPSEESFKMRSSVLFCGALLGRFKKAFISGTGGCNLGKRPIDMHLWAFKKMGAQIRETKGGIYIRAEKLKGTELKFKYTSVGATENAVIAAACAEGKTIIRNAAKEPEIWDLAAFLNLMGADIKGAGSQTIEINGVEKLNGCRYKIMPDRIEAGTFLCAAAAAGGRIMLKNAPVNCLKAPIDVLKKCGCIINIQGNNIFISSEKKPVGNIKIKTEPFPFFPTDLQAPIMAVLACAKGKSVVKEKIFSSRNAHIRELNKMGADIKIKTNRKFIISGSAKFKGTNVSASDLRAGASLIIAGLCAEGETTIENADYIYRGYENIVGKLQGIGADIECL